MSVNATKDAKRLKSYRYVELYTEKKEQQPIYIEGRKRIGCMSVTYSVCISVRDDSVAANESTD